MNTPTNGFVPARILKFQVGALLTEPKGHFKEQELTIPRVRIAEDVMVEYLRGLLRFSRTSRGILVQGKLHTTLPADCTRCLTPIEVPVTLELEEVYVYPPEASVEFTLSDDGILDLASLLRQEVLLETPIGVLCKEDCLGLCLECGQNLNEGPCTCNREGIDPRLAALAALRSKFRGVEDE
ncbi:MAG: hypothetical protein OHK0023_07550 [Anaerolineae bacterium]